MRPGETPVPIPNTMVKTRAADGTMLETAWESRWPPNIIKNNAQAAMRGKKCIPAMDDCMGQSGSRRSRYLENCILKESIENIPGIRDGPGRLGLCRQTSRDIRLYIARKLILEEYNLTKRTEKDQITLYLAKAAVSVKLIRAQGGCLGTKSRRKT